jgi:hypothetical protein
MYKTASRNLQSRGGGGGPVIDLQAKKLAQNANADAFVAAEFRRIIDPERLAKLGGWPIERFGLVGVKLSYLCRKCGHHTEPENAELFVRQHTHFLPVKQLVYVHRAIRCKKCAQSAPGIGIHVGRAIVWFG